MNRLLLVIALLAAGSASAQEPRLSDRGRLLIAGELGGWWQNHDNWHVGIGPSLAYFVRDRMGLGGYLTYENGRQGWPGTRLRSYQLGVASVNELALGARLGLWLDLHAGYLHRDQDGVPTFNLFPTAGEPTGVSAFTTGSKHWARFGLFVPLVYQLNHHVGVGIGPDLAIDWSPKDAAVDVQVGLKTWIPVSI